MKRDKLLIVISSVIILIPVIVSLALWDRLPDEMPIHWDAQGQVDGYASKPVAAIGMPLLLLLIHYVCIFITRADPKNKNIKGKPFALVVSIIPVLSLALGAVTISVSLEYTVDIVMILSLLMGALFAVIGNYLPKCKQNYTIGIKLPWTLSSEENWNKTHRFAGVIWVVGGLLVMLTSFLRNPFIMMSILLAMAFVPMIYSYVLYRKAKTK